MKTKIVYISGNEIFDMADIRAAFEEVRNALNLDKTTVLFGVPVDADDTGLMNQETTVIDEIEPVIEDTKIEIVETEPELVAENEIIDEPASEIAEEIPVENIVAEKPKKRGRPAKETLVQETVGTTTEPTEEEKVVPILSILSTKEVEQPEPEIITQEIEIISEVSDEETENIDTEEITEETVEDINEEEIEPTEDEVEDDLEKLLSEMTPLQEDILDDKKEEEIPAEPEDNDDVSVDATLEQLATEFAETQDKIATENKSSARSKIGKLRNILPFKQSKHKDQGLGDLFGWAGVAANDEDFSVPGFFTNAASKK